MGKAGGMNKSKKNYRLKILYSVFFLHSCSMDDFRFKKPRIAAFIILFKSEIDNIPQAQFPASFQSIIR